MIFRALVLGLAAVMPGVALAGNCVAPGEVAVMVPQKDGWFIGSIGGTFVGPDCYFDMPATKGWTIRLKIEGDVKLSIAQIGYSRIDPLQPFVAKADGPIRLLITRTTERGSAPKYKLVYDLRKPGL